MVTRDHITLFIHAEAAVRVAVIRKPDIESLFHHKSLQSFDVGRTCIAVDIRSIRLRIDHVSLCTERIKNSLCNIPGASVRTVQSDLLAAERVHAKRDQIADITVSSGNIIHGTADLLLLRKRDLRPFLSEYFQLTVQIRLHQRDRLLIHLLAVSVDQLDAVIIIRIVACGDHDTTVKLIHPRDIRHRRCRRNVKQVCIRTRSDQSADQRILKHIA